MRVKPGFEPGSDQAQHKGDKSPGCITFLVILVAGYFVLFAIARVISGYGSTIDLVICNVVLAFLLIVLALSPFIMKKQ